MAGQHNSVVGPEAGWDGHESMRVVAAKPEPLVTSCVASQQTVPASVPASGGGRCLKVF